ncbi:hypothetical protein [Salinibius halmophilus]|uniref:hypothetical protein n=1 Tax=Salinibius halmophilus TaxID=1853216 RepID=UPI000E66C8EA|nr:hypothetical protein [Salinibius halmophilus]
MISTQASQLTQWLRRVSGTPIAIISQQHDIERAVEAGELSTLLLNDPLLAMRLFQAAKHIPKGQPIETASQLIDLLGPRQVLALCKDMKRIDFNNTLHQGLLRSVGDALLAAELLKCWFAMRHIEFTEADYWQTIFDGAPIFAMWWTDPLIMEGADHNTAITKSIQQRIAGHLDCRYLQVLEAMQMQWELPVALNLANSKHPKAMAMKYFLPFSHEIAHCARRSWRSDQFLDACRRGGIALGINHFATQLRGWMLDVTHNNPQSLANQAMRQYVTDQPYEHKIKPRPAPVMAKPIDHDGLNSLLYKMHPKQLAYLDRIDLFDGLLGGMQSCLHSKACLIAVPHLGKYDVMAWRGMSKPQSAIAPSSIMKKLSEQSVSLWINEKNRAATLPHLPAFLAGLAEQNEIMLRSVVNQGRCQAVIVAVYQNATPDHYQRFRQLATAFGTALDAV